MELRATIDASPYDEHYNMALVYCYDEAKCYCFSLSRFPGEEEIEVMVRDQSNWRTNDLAVSLRQNELRVWLEPSLALKLDHHQEYVISFEMEASAVVQLKAALTKIFEGKHGLSIVE